VTLFRRILPLAAVESTGSKENTRRVHLDGERVDTQLLRTLEVQACHLVTELLPVNHEDMLTLEFLKFLVKTGKLL
jgi:hypothetical protein